MLLLALLACASRDDASPVATQDCADAVAVSWDEWGQGFFGTWCRSCHSATTPDRRGAPVGTDFDTWTEVQAQAAAIQQAVLDSGTMPVGGGISADDRALLEALLQCGTGGEGVAPGGSGSGTDLDAAQVAARADAAFAGGLPLATTLWEAYVGVLEAHAEGSCPNGAMGPAYAIQASMKGCSTSQGWYFWGLTLRESTVDGDAWTEWMLGDGWAHDPDGHRLVFGGEIAWSGTRGASESWSQSVDGTWGWEGGEGWLAAVPSVAVSVDATGHGDTLQATVHGGWTLNGDTVFLDDLRFDSAASGSPASGSAASRSAPAGGAVRVRDDAGARATLSLREDGSGCGEVRAADGQELGEACVDASPLVASLRAYAP